MIVKILRRNFMWRRILGMKRWMGQICEIPGWLRYPTRQPPRIVTYDQDCYTLHIYLDNCKLQYFYMDDVRSFTIRPCKTITYDEDGNSYDLDGRQINNSDDEYEISSFTSSGETKDNGVITIDY